MSSRSLSLTVFLYRFAGAVLLTAAFPSGCGSGTSPGGPTGGGGTGGIASSAGGTSGGPGGSSTSAGGTTGVCGTTPSRRNSRDACVGNAGDWRSHGDGDHGHGDREPSTTVGTIGADFTGFSYEKTHIMNGSLTINTRT